MVNDYTKHPLPLINANPPKNCYYPLNTQVLKHTFFYASIRLDIPFPLALCEMLKIIIVFPALISFKSHNISQ